MERIYVTVRPRPLSTEDAKSSPWRISGNSISISNQPYKFDFDRIFPEDCRTKQVYEARTKDIVGAAVRGFNGTVFAYGQTNSGKTHTMRGSTVEPGVIPLAVHDLFHIIQEDVDREFLLRMSYMEIYNEEINDLLAPEHRKLQIHENLEKGIFVAGLREEIVATPEQVLDFMEFGESHRHIGETNMNVYSSRSHTIFRMIIESRIKSEDGDIGNSCDAVRVSVLNLVDLAGSERAAKTGAEGMRLKEGSHINKSLMTLGTVIKKLSEGVESQGGHVPYRDSKLTRILQPSLGGNANTAIICNITLAQIHADETKSSLQFASRALRVTNCARVNEILTDAALLKRQKKEIEELKARLQGSHAEHFEEEILSLRNTLLQSELERERITLELQEEKKAQALRERRLQEQAKKIENLSSMVLKSNADEESFACKRDKRRQTWCPSVISREALRQEPSKPQCKAERDMGLPLPFEELVYENQPVKEHFPEDDCTSGGDSCTSLLEDSILPDSCSLLNVTNRRKAPIKKKNSVVSVNNESVDMLSVMQQNNELFDMQTEYDDLLVEYEIQRITKDIEVNCLMEKLTATGQNSDMTNATSFTNQLKENKSHGDKGLTSRELEAIIVIKHLQEKVKMLETEKSSIQQNLDDVIELATENNISAVGKYEELHQEFQNAHKENSLPLKEPPLKASIEKTEEDFDPAMELLAALQDMELEIQSSRNTVESISSVTAELFQCFAEDLKMIACENAALLKSFASDHQKIYASLQKKIDRLESDKCTFYDQSIDLNKQIGELRLNLQETESILRERCQQHDLDKYDFLSQIGNLEKEVSCLSSSCLARERDSLRKELEKTKLKLKETEFKLKNSMQEKTKLEGEKAQSEREIKQLHCQKALLERDICKRDSLADRRRESRGFESNKAIQFEQAMQGEYKKLEVLAFEMETTIASLEEQLVAVSREKQEAFMMNGTLEKELEATSNKLSMTNSELRMLQEEVSVMRGVLADSESSNKTMESSINLLLVEKEELAMQLTDALLELDEEKAIWATKEKASIEAIAEKTKLSTAELELLAKELSEERLELESCKEECKILRERLSISEENVEHERKWRCEKSSEIDQLRHDLTFAESESEKCQKERDQLLARNEELQKLEIELEMLQKNSENLILKAKAGEEMEIKMQNITVSNFNEKAKLKMRLRSVQAKLDAFRGRYNEAVVEIGVMNRKYEEASGKLKEQLASYAGEVLHLKKQIATREG